MLRLSQSPRQFADYSAGYAADTPLTPTMPTTNTDYGHRLSLKRPAANSDAHMDHAGAWQNVDPSLAAHGLTKRLRHDTSMLEDTTTGYMRDDIEMLGALANSPPSVAVLVDEGVPLWSTPDPLQQAPTATATTTSGSVCAAQPLWWRATTANPSTDRLPINSSSSSSSSQMASPVTQFSMGYRGDCAQCLARIPGHYAHLHRSSDG